MTRILITGGAGFVGSSLSMGIKRLRPHFDVIALDNLKRRGSELNLPRLKKAGIVFVHGDVRIKEDLNQCKNINIIIDCSAEPSVLKGYQEPEYLIDTNFTGTINCLNLARKFGAGIIFMSTSRVYPVETINSLNYREKKTRLDLNQKQLQPGVSKKGISEQFPLGNIRTLYGASKLCSEIILKEYLDIYAINGIINRCGVITGPWQMGKVDQGFVVIWVARHIFGGKLNYIGYHGKGKQVRDILHIEDLIDLILFQLDSLEKLSGKTFNVGGGPKNSISLLELTEKCRQITGKVVKVGQEPQNRPGDVPWYISDNTFVNQATGWCPDKGVDRIIEDITKWIWDYEVRLKPIIG